MSDEEVASDMPEVSSGNDDAIDYTPEDTSCGPHYEDTGSTESNDTDVND